MICIATTSTRYTMGTAAKKPSRAAHGRAPLLATGGAGRQLHPQVREDAAGDEHDDHVDRRQGDADVRQAMGRVRPASRTPAG